MESVVRRQYLRQWRKNPPVTRSLIYQPDSTHLPITCPVRSDRSAGRPTRQTIRAYIKGPGRRMSNLDQLPETATNYTLSAPYRHGRSPYDCNTSTSPGSVLPTSEKFTDDLFSTEPRDFRGVSIRCRRRRPGFPAPQDARPRQGRRPERVPPWPAPAAGKAQVLLPTIHACMTSDTGPESAPVFNARANSASFYTLLFSLSENSKQHTLPLT